MSKLLLALLLPVALLGAGALLSDWQAAARAGAQLLPVTFAHRDHDAVSCIACHHNYVDDTGQGLCFDCHKTDTSVNALVETQFHELCWGCHVSEQALGNDFGPTRQCIDCHEADDNP